MLQQAVTYCRSQLKAIQQARIAKAQVWQAPSAYPAVTRPGGRNPDQSTCE